MRNKFFQMLWYSIRGVYPYKTGDGLTLDCYSQRMEKSLSFADWFGEVKCAVLGDSNGATLDKSEKMTLLWKDQDGIAVNLAIGGTRADQWADFLSLSPVGTDIARKLKGSKIVFNIGGNNVLQNRLTLLKSSLQKLKDIFPDSYNCLIPPIHAQLAGVLLGRTADEIRIDIDKANSIIREIFQDKAIDTFTPFLNPDGSGEPYFIVLKDAVHFSDWADMNIRIPLIRGRIL